MKTTNTWGKKVLQHQYPPILERFPRLIHLLYAWNRWSQLRNWYVKRALSKLFSEMAGPFTCCDVGCGEGMHVLPYAKKYSHGSFEGVDHQVTHIRFLHSYRNRFSQDNFSLIFQDIATFSRRRCYDLITCIGVLQYVDADEQVLKQFYKALQPGGKCLVYVPIEGRFICRLLQQWLSQLPTYDSLQDKKRTYSAAEIEAKFLESGFGIVGKTYTYGFWGKVAYELQAFWLAIILHFSMVFKIGAAIGLLLSMPLILGMMVLDFATPVSRGNGLLLLGRKPVGGISKRPFQGA